MVERSKESTRLLTDLAEKIRLVTPTVDERNEINVFEGYHGLRRAFYEHLERVSKKETLRIIGFGSRMPERRALSKFLDDINAIAHKKKCVVTILLDESYLKKTEIVKMQSYTNIHFLPASYFGPTAYNISKTEVLLTVWGKDPLVIRIRNPIIVASFTAHFDFLTSISKKRK
jgi:predicted DNA-binding ribbon-helix-helix protein